MRSFDSKKNKELSDNRYQHPTEPFNQLETDSDMWIPGKILMDEYRIEEIIGKGGMGIVYRVSQFAGNRVFAVKTLISGSETRREAYRNLIREIRTWIDMPAHPNITICHYFRTIENRLAVFAEYIDGGSLRDWIDSMKLTSIRPILDIAIQTAWGLHAAHEHGVIHQDIKPANILITKGGQAKITDFGLSRAKFSSNETGIKSPARETTLVVNTSGMTIAYCSPEQMQGSLLTRRSDMWSWALTLMEMLLGKATWKTGMIGPHILEKMKESQSSMQIPELPSALMDILDGCFQQNPADRWDNMKLLAEKLIVLYKEVTRTDYPRMTPQVPAENREILPYERKLPSGAQWIDPMIWLRKAFQSSGLDPSDIENEDMPSGGSRKIQALNDLEILDKSESMMYDLYCQGHKELITDYVEILSDKSFVFSAIGDLPGSSASFDRLIRFLQSYPLTQTREDLNYRLARSYLNKAFVSRELKNSKEALLLYQRAREIFEYMTEVQKLSKYRHSLAAVYVNSGVNLMETGDLHGAENLYEKAISIWKDLIEKDNLKEFMPFLAIAYMNRSNINQRMNRVTQAINWIDLSIEIYEAIIIQDKSIQILISLANALMNKGICYRRLDKAGEAIVLYDRTISILRKIIAEEDRPEQAKELSRALMNKAAATTDLGDLVQTTLLQDEAISLSEDLVFRLGCLEWRENLALLYSNKTSHLIQLKQMDTALKTIEKSLDIFQSIYSNSKHNPEYINQYANACSICGLILNKMNRHEEAESRYALGVELLHSLMLEDHKYYSSNYYIIQIQRSQNLIAIGNNPEAVSVLKEARENLKTEIALTGRTDLSGYLCDTET